MRYLAAFGVLVTGAFGLTLGIVVRAEFALITGGVIALMAIFVGLGAWGSEVEDDLDSARMERDFLREECGVLREEIRKAEKGKADTPRPSATGAATFTGNWD